MKVAFLKTPGGLSNIKIAQRPAPRINDDEILVRIHASSLNYHDYLVANGAIPTEDGRILMSDGAGIVEQVGKDVTEFSSGDQVISVFFPDWPTGPITTAGFGSVPGDGIDGFSCEYVAVKPSAITLAPIGWSHAEAATLPCAALTAWRALMVEAQIKPGDTVLVQGSGGVSIFALQFAKMAGAKVIATTSSDEKIAKLKELGADECINYKTHPKWSKVVQELTDGRGVDEVVEIGGAGTLTQSIRSCRVGGHISVIGIITGMSAELPTHELFGRNLRLSGITVGSRSMQKDMIAAIEANSLKPVICDCFSLEGLADAFAHQESGKHFGKILVEY